MSNMATNTTAQCHKIIFNTSSFPDRQYSCKVCSKAFKRSEHRLRHERAHTQEKPFNCRYCHKGYSRRDLVVRHEKTLHASQYSAQAKTKRNDQGRKRVRRDDLCRDSQDETASTSEEMVLRNSDNPTEEDSGGGAITVDYDNNSTIPPAVPPDPIFSSDPPNVLFTDDAASSSMGDQPSLIGNVSRKTNEHTLAAQQEHPLVNETIPAQQNDSMITTNDVVFPNLDFFDIFLGLGYDTSEALGVDANLDELGRFSPFPEVRQSSPQQTERGRRDRDHAAGIEQVGSQSPRNKFPGGMRTPLARAQSHILPQTTRRSDNATSTSTSSPISTSPTTSSSFPKVIKTSLSSRGFLVIKPQTRTTLRTDLATRLSQDDLWDFEFPDTVILERCLRSYTDAFHIHLPIFHFPSLIVEQTPSPLILMMCAIGALYRLERKLATSLYRKASQAFTKSLSSWLASNESLLALDGIQTMVREDPSPAWPPLWMMQTRFLLAVFGTLNGNAGLIKRAFGLLGAQWMDCHLMLSSLGVSGGIAEMSWTSWTERELLKRICYGIIILSHMLTTAYGLGPAFSTAQVASLEMPGDQDLWDASSEGQWHILRRELPRSTLLSLGEAVAKLMYDKSNSEALEDSWNWSPFATCVVMHAVATQIWHISSANSLGMLPEGSGLRHFRVGSNDISQTEIALSRCRELLISAKRASDATWNDEDGPMLFNCMAVLRVAYCRACMPTAILDRFILLRENRSEIIDAIQRYLDVDQPRGESITKAVARSIEGLFVPIQAGVLWTIKTAALTWWVDHAFAGWDTALFVTRWIHEIELAEHRREPIDSLERKTIQEARRLMNEAQIPYVNTDSLASAVANFWAAFFIDTWVWGVTPRIGFVLQELAKAYEHTSPVQKSLLS